MGKGKLEVDTIKGDRNLQVMVRWWMMISSLQAKGTNLLLYSQIGENERIPFGRRIKT